VKKYEQCLRHAVNAWENRNIKQIGYKEISELNIDLQEKGLSSKYRYDIVSTLKTFYRWLYNTGEIKIDQLCKRFLSV
jgi:site-specific recombinase XerD